MVELKSLKLYLWSYRNESGFHEDVTNRILDDLVAAAAPRRMTVTTDWLVREASIPWWRHHTRSRTSPVGYRKGLYPWGK